MTSKLITRVHDRILRAQDERRRRNLPKPSFYAHLANRKRIGERARQMRNVPADEPIYEIETKLGQKRVAERAGVHFPGILQGPFEQLANFDLAALPDQFVIKPVVGSGSNGVFLLEKRGDALFDYLTQQSFPADLTSLHEAGLNRFDCPIIAEEMAAQGGRPSVNWKVFAFYGEIGFLRQVDLNSPQSSYKMWSPEGRDIGKIDKHSFPYDASLPAPRDLEALLEAARAVSVNVMTPFMRVDLYESDYGVSLGEVTLRPGSLWKHKYLHEFTPEWDRKLGVLWEDAEARLVETVGEAYIL